MASTINATTSGIVNIGDSVATLALQTGGTTAVAIDTAQIVTLSKSLALLGSTSGSVTIAAPAVAGSTTITLPATSGTLLQSGTAVTIAQGGTGQTTASAAFDALAPSQTSNSGKYLTTNGTTTSWGTVSGGSAATPTALGTVYGATGSGTPFTAALGYQAAASTTGVNVTAVGYQAGYTNTSGTSNTFVGYQAGYLATGSLSTAIGYQAGYNNTDAGGSTTFVGYKAGNANTSGYGVAVGANAALTNITGAEYVAIGNNALRVATGNRNTAVGEYAGSTLTTGTNNVLLGYLTSASAVSGANQIVIGSSTVGQADSNVTIGSSAGKIYNAFTVNATWTQTSDGRLKTNVNDDSLGLSFINRLRPVTFTWKASPDIDPSLPYYNEVNQRDTNTVIHGLIAQEVKAALDAEGCSTFNGWDAGNEDTIQAISREMFISPLIKAIQELSAANEALTARIAALEAK